MAISKIFILSFQLCEIYNHMEKEIVGNENGCYVGESVEFFQPYKISLNVTFLY